MKKGDAPAVVARVIVTAATDKKPELCCTAGLTRRLVPAGAFDKQIRKNNQHAHPTSRSCLKGADSARMPPR
jgi:hypothetical protein